MAVTHLFRRARYLDLHRPAEAGPPVLVGHVVSPFLCHREIAWPPVAPPPPLEAVLPTMLSSALAITSIRDAACGLRSRRASLRRTAGLARSVRIQRRPHRSPRIVGPAANYGDRHSGITGELVFQHGDIRGRQASFKHREPTLLTPSLIYPAAFRSGLLEQPPAQLRISARTCAAAESASAPRS